ncbi:MAG: hypothetical protein JWO90_654 [Solirubrobacterales bacterium]|jgi:predicted nucleic acid-binding protein|nr:hypothetical protein [Solirubrobacterales bacterium]
MAVVVDASFVLALADAAAADHAAAVAWLATEDEDLVTTPLVVAAVDDALAAHPEARDAVRRDLLANAYTVRWWADALVETTTIARREDDLTLSDASLVAVAARVGTHRIATFRPSALGRLTALDGDPFVLLPQR